MMTDFDCQICGCRSWQVIERMHFSRSDHVHPKNEWGSLLLRKLKIVGRRIVLAKPNTKSIRCTLLDAYQVKRRQVLFDVWYPGQEDVFIETVFCKKCGFATCSPRPEENNVAAKYQYLKKIEPDIGEVPKRDDFARKLDAARAARIFQLTTPFLPARRLQILDYGGGDGKLLKPFLDEGHDCFLVDYNDEISPGIRKIGNDINDIDSSGKYDLILCSHVLEHVSNISGLVTALRRLLEVNGILYAEVPQQIWAGIEVEADPVTHINFFTMNSLSRLLMCSGFSILKKKQGISNYGKNFLEIIWIVANQGPLPEERPLENDILGLLYPARFSSLKKMLAISIIPKFKEKLFSLSSMIHGHEYRA